MSFCQDEVFGFGSTYVHQLTDFYNISLLIHYIIIFYHDLKSDKTPWPVWISVCMEETAHE